MSAPLTPETPAVTPEAPATQPETVAGVTEEVPADVLRRLLTEAREEAAATRVKKKEEVEATKSTITQEFEAKLAESNTAHESTKVKLAQTALYAEKLQAAVDAKIPHEKIVAFANLLQGSNVDELKAHADTLKGMFGIASPPPPAVDPTAGAGNGELPLNGDPLLQALTNKLGIR